VSSRAASDRQRKNVSKSATTLTTKTKNQQKQNKTYKQKTKKKNKQNKTKQTIKSEVNRRW
jgi:secreted trypsin-like serine protease